MSRTSDDLGKLVSVHAIEPIYVQRAAFVVILSFVFFMITMLIYYVRQSALYFLLATGFMVIYIITLISWVLQKKRVVELHDNGVRYRGLAIRWQDIREVRRGNELALGSGKTVVLPQTLHGAEQLMAAIHRGMRSTVR